MPKRRNLFHDSVPVPLITPYRFTAAKFVLKMCENVGIRRVKTSDSDIFTHFQIKFSGAVKRSLTFQIFVLVVFFGLYNGLVVLPILLSFCGPSFKPSEGEQSSDRQGSDENGSRQASSIISPTIEQDAVCDDELKKLSPKKPAGIRVTTC